MNRYDAKTLMTPCINPALPNRIDAVRAAILAAEMIKRDERAGGDWTYAYEVVGALRCQEVFVAPIRAALDKLLDAPCTTPQWRACWVRRYVGDCEAALGLEHDPRSREAHTAGASSIAWREYVNAAMRVTAKVGAAS